MNRYKILFIWLRRVMILLAVVFFLVWETECVSLIGKTVSYKNFSENQNKFRYLDINENIIREFLTEKDTAGKVNFIRKLATGMLYYDFSISSGKQLQKIPWLWNVIITEKTYLEYYEKYYAILTDLKCFPVPDDVKGGETISYEDSWGAARNYGGKRIHEGTDIMASNNKRGYFPILSMTDGTVEQKGWLEKGGYRIGIRSPSGAYFYYAHLCEYADDLEIGQKVFAGQLLGSMGDTGYGKEEGTTGKFDVHLHMGIYLDVDGKEISLNPYHILKAMEGSRISFRIKE